MNRIQLEKYILDTYGVVGECMWEKYPSFSVFRHGDNRKWFAVIMRIPISKLGVMENRHVNLVNLKLSEDVLDLAWETDGVFPAYHMNKQYWISVLLDGSVDDDVVIHLLNASFKATEKKKKDL